MVNARNLGLAGLATTVVIAVVGVETYNSGVYRTKIDFHADVAGLMDITRGSIFAESASTLGRSTKGDDMADFNNSKTLEARMELSNGLTYVQIGEESSVFLRTEHGYGVVVSGVALSDTDFEAPTINMEAAKAAPTVEGSSVSSTVEGTIHSISGPDGKIVFDQVVNGAAATHVDFSEENALLGRNLLATRSVRGRNLGIFKKTKDWWDKYGKTVSCLASLALALAFIAACCSTLVVALGNWVALTIPVYGIWMAGFIYNFCFMFATFPGVQGMFDHCGPQVICDMREGIYSGWAC